MSNSGSAITPSEDTIALNLNMRTSINERMQGVGKVLKKTYNQNLFKFILKRNAERDSIEAEKTMVYQANHNHKHKTLKQSKFMYFSMSDSDNSGDAKKEFPKRNL